VGSVDSGLSFYDRIGDGDFTLWIYDQNGNVVNPGGAAITIDADVTSLNDIAAQLDATHANITASTASGSLQITADNNFTFAFSGDTSGALAALGVNTYFKGDGAGSIGMNAAIGSETNRIAAGRINTDGTFSLGNNVNAMAIADLQFAAMSVSQWTCDRIQGYSEGQVTSTLENYYHSLAGSVGITASSISRGKTFNQGIVSNLNSIRDSISAVSIDEEMTSLMQFQHAYTAASKLISTADEMMQTLLELR
jgi:flagellar hook-associated protein 1 FlgK